MATYDLGDGIPLEHEVLKDNVLTDATVALALTKPDGSPLAPSVTHPSTGRYEALPLADQIGIWSGVWMVSGTVTRVKPFSFTVADPAALLYTELPMVKGALDKWTSDDRDDLIEGAIRTACRRIDKRCGRRFYVDAAASARKVPVVGQSFSDGAEQVLLVDDIATATGLLVESGDPAWAAVTGWEYGDDHALVDGWPITQLRAPAGWLPTSGRVRITARWGWPAVPDQISQAALLLAVRLYRRKDSPQGVLGSPEFGGIRVARFDSDVEDLIADFMLPGIA